MIWCGFLAGEWQILKLRWTIRALLVKLAFLRARHWWRGGSVNAHHEAARTPSRLLIFALAGPPMSEAVIFFILYPLVGTFSFQPMGMLFLLPVAYVNGIIPALLAGVVDDVAARKGLQLRSRLLISAVAGFLLAFVPLLAALYMDFISGPWILPFGLVGGVPAALCCLLVERYGQRRMNHTKR